MGAGWFLLTHHKPRCAARVHVDSVQAGWLRDGMSVEGLSVAERSADGGEALVAVTRITLSGGLLDVVRGSTLHACPETFSRRFVLSECWLRATFKLSSGVFDFVHVFVALSDRLTPGALCVRSPLLPCPEAAPFTMYTMEVSE